MTDEEKIKQVELLIEDAVKEGRVRLREHVSKLGEYPVVEYQDKNQHIIPEVRVFADGFMQSGKFNLMETCWLNITDETDLINKSRKDKLNRGISLANTGISQIVQAKVEEGVFNLYRALADDEEVLKKLGIEYDPEKNLVNNSLFAQFEDPILKELLDSAIKPNLIMGENPLTFKQLQDFFIKQSPSTRIFIFGKLRQLLSSLRRNEILDNMMSRQSILDSLSSLCLWVEDSLRRKTPSTSGLYDGLKFLPLPSITGGFRSNGLDELLGRIKLVEKESDINIKRALVTILIRNYSGHNLQTTQHDFFDSKERIFTYVGSIMLTMLLLESKSKI